MNYKKYVGVITALAAGITCLSTAQAEENLWMYAKGTDTRPQGSVEIKIQDILRDGKFAGDYSFHEIRPSIEYGITDKLTVGAELMIFRHDYSITNPDLQPYYDTQGGEGGRFKETAIGGYEFGLKYNFLSPYKDAFGFSMGLAWDHRDKYRLDGADINQDALEIYAYFQKNFLDDTLVFVFNPKMELERRTSGEGFDFVLEEEIALDVAAAVSYRFAPKWFIGAEYRHQSDYLSPLVIDPDTGGLVEDDPSLDQSDIDLLFPKFGTQHQNGNYFGPSIHYATERWWATASILLQVSGGGSENAFNANGKNYDEHEERHIGVTFGYEF
ncbi:MAG: DUF6662 family protein [Pseudomonadota bacterium]